MWPKDAAERRTLLYDGRVSEEQLQIVWTVDMMAPGNQLIFAATGISDSPMLAGIQYRRQHCITHSILMRARNRTVRKIEAYHDLAQNDPTALHRPGNVALTAAPNGGGAATGFDGRHCVLSGKTSPPI